MSDFGKEFKIELTEAVAFIIEKLESDGFSAYAVGGAVRDSVLGLTPEDWDIATSALPEQTKEVFKGFPVLETGIKHGTVTVIVENRPYEVTAYRKESGYSDNRHPDKVEFVGDISEDLSRRDFTVNSLAYNKKSGIIDLYGGLSDIENKVIRTVGRAEERFSEDALRILRAVRFSSKLGFEIESETLEQAVKLRKNLKNVSAERIFSEFIKTLCGKAVMNALLSYREIIAEIVPEIRLCFDFEQHSSWHLYDVYEHIVRSVAVIKPVRELRTAMFFHDIKKPSVFFTKNGEGHFYGHADLSADAADKILRRLKAPNAFREKVVFLVKNHDKPFSETSFKLKKLLNAYGEEGFFELCEVKRADSAAQGTEKALTELQKTKATEEKVKEIIKSGECYSVKTLEINGDDLKEIGFCGKDIGEEINELLNLVMSEPKLNEKTKLKGLAEKRFKGLKSRL